MNYSASCHKTSGVALSQGGSPARGDKPPEYGSRISVEEGLLILRWSTEHTPEAMRSAGMTLKDVLAKHLRPGLDATKTVSIRRRGQPTESYRYPDGKTRLRAIALVVDFNKELKELLKGSYKVPKTCVNEQHYQPKRTRALTAAPGSLLSEGS